MMKLVDMMDSKLASCFVSQVKIKYFDSATRVSHRTFEISTIDASVNWSCSWVNNTRIAIQTLKFLKSGEKLVVIGRGVSAQETVVARKHITCAKK